MARKTKNEDIMDSISYAKDVLKSDGGSAGAGLVASSAGGAVLTRILGSKLGSKKPADSAKAKK